MSAGGLPVLDVAGLTIGVREGLIILIALLGLYMLLEFWRMRRLRRRQGGGLLQEPLADVEPLSTVDMIAARHSQAEHPGSPREPEVPPLEAQRASGASSPDCQDLLRDIDQLRDELDAVRGELAGLRADMQQELAHMRAAQTVSPLYGDAMQMALAGHDATRIAERCGIARAEADLVVALARSQSAAPQ